MAQRLGLEVRVAQRSLKARGLVFLIIAAAVIPVISRSRITVPAGFHASVCLKSSVFDSLLTADNTLAAE